MAIFGIAAHYDADVTQDFFFRLAIAAGHTSMAYTLYCRFSF
jgi:hypothetical protein